MIIVSTRLLPLAQLGLARLHGQITDKEYRERYRLLMARLK